MRTLHRVVVYATAPPHCGDTEKFTVGPGIGLEVKEQGVVLTDQDVTVLFPWHRIHEVEYR